MTGAKLIELLRKNLVCVICVAVSIVLAAVIYLRSDILPEAESTLADRSAEGERLQANVENSSQLKEQYAALVAANQTIQYRLIRQGELAENLQHFYKLEAETTTKFTDLRQTGVPRAPKGAPKTNFVPIGFTVTLTGEYAAAIDFLRRVENGAPYSRVLDCSIVPPGGTERSGSVTFRLDIELLGLP